ncbi:ABC transporter ATP-binding protein [Desulfococcaceae bacterium HSG7]|nr:ABC transporter ATP-binding protein [Desulfococcaceae bacterium HSG7]
MNETVIKIENLSKLYRLGQVGTGTLSHDLNRWWAKVRGKEDPFAQIGQVNDRTKQAESDYVWALKDINLEVKHGEVLGIIGRNGAGKSTLLKLISRITAPTTGKIKAKGRIASLLEVGTGMHPEMTARENIYLNGAILGMRRHEIDRKFDDIVDFAGCAMYVGTPVKRFSSGMRVRLGFAVAAFLEPDILIVDEVLAVGDAEFQKKAIGKMKEVSTSQGRTVLFVSHNMATIQNLCENAVLLGKGQIVLSDVTDMVIERYLQETIALSKIALNERNDRQGNGNIKFTEVILQNQRGETVSAFQSGQSARFILCFTNHTHADLKDFHIAIGIDNHIGERITLLSNQLSGRNFVSESHEINAIEIYIEKLPLTSGRYQFTIFSAIDDVITDWIKNAGFFYVEAGDYYGTGKIPPTGHGNFLVNCRFSPL